MISSYWRSAPPVTETTSRNAATCGRRTSAAISLPAAEYGWTMRSAPARRSFSATSASEARATISRSGLTVRAESVM